MKRTPEQQLATAEAVANTPPEERHEDPRQYRNQWIGEFKDGHEDDADSLNDLNLPDDGPINIPARLEQSVARRWGAARYREGGGE